MVQLSIHPLEELFKGSRKTLRVLRVLLLANAPLSKYAIEVRAAVYGSGPLLKRLVKLGVVRTLTGPVTRYTINYEHPLVKAVERLMKDARYLETGS